MILQNGKKKRRKKNKNNDTFDDLWNNDLNLTQKEQQQLEEEDIYVVDKVIGHRNIGNKKYEYNVSWVGYEDSTWEPPNHLNPFTIQQYWKNEGIKIDAKGAMIHLKNKKNKKNKKSKKFKCIPCNKIFKNGHALGGHNASKHRKDAEIEDDGDNREHHEPYWEDSDDD